MIQDTNAEDLASLGQLAVHAQVGFARLQFTGGVVMGKDHGCRPVGNDVGEDLARMNWALIEQTNGDDAFFYHLIGAV